MVEDLIKKLRMLAGNWSVNLGKSALEAIDLIEQQAARIAELEHEAGFTKPIDAADASYPNALAVAQTLRNCNQDLHTEARFVLWQSARLTALESERDALLAAAGKEAVAYVRGTDLEDLKDKRIAGKGCFLNKEPRDGFVALYTAPTAALEKGDGRDAETLSALYDLLMCRDVEMGEAYLTLRVVGVPPEGDEFVDALSAALSQQKAGDQQ